MRIEMWLKETSQPIRLDRVKNTYQKGDMFCVSIGNIVFKFPMNTIFRVIEDYNPKQETAHE